MFSYDNKERQKLHESRKKHVLRWRKANPVWFISWGLVLSLQAHSADVLAENESCPAFGQVSVELYGAMNETINWSAAELGCTGMPRPNNEGARLRFSGPGNGTHRLAIILGIPDLEIGVPGKELETNVTLIEEDTGRFFNSADPYACWTDIKQQHLEAQDSGVYQIQGKLYCVTALAELNSSASVTIGTMEFSGVLNWEQPH